MKGKITLGFLVITAAMPVLAIAEGTRITNTVPEPSTLALFASTAIAILIAKRFKK